MTALLIEMLDPLLVLRLQLQSNRFRRKPGEIHQGTLRRGTERPAAALSVVEFSAGKAGGDPDAALRSGFGEAPALSAGAGYSLIHKKQEWEWLSVLLPVCRFPANLGLGQLIAHVQQQLDRFHLRRCRPVQL